MGEGHQQFLCSRGKRFEEWARGLRVLSTYSIDEKQLKYCFKWFIFDVLILLQSLQSAVDAAPVGKQGFIMVHYGGTCILKVSVHLWKTAYKKYSKIYFNLYALTAKLLHRF